MRQSLGLKMPIDLIIGAGHEPNPSPPTITHTDTQTVPAPGGGGTAFTLNSRFLIKDFFQLNFVQIVIQVSAGTGTNMVSIGAGFEINSITIDRIDFDPALSFGAYVTAFNTNTIYTYSQQRTDILRNGDEINLFFGCTNSAPTADINFRMTLVGVYI